MPVVCVVIGEGGSGGALAVGVGNRVLDDGRSGLLGDFARGLRSDPVEGSSRGSKAATALKITAADCLISRPQTRSLRSPREVHTGITKGPLNCWVRRWALLWKS